MGHLLRKNLDFAERCEIAMAFGAAATNRERIWDF
jgi:hypothetical protein